MKRTTVLRLILGAALTFLSVQLASAMDMRFDVATFDGGANGNTQDGDTDWFYNGQMQYLNFPSVNGHQIDQSGSTHLSTIQAEGNTLGTYYNDFDSLYSSTETPAEAVSTIESYIKAQSGSYETSRWLVLNEISSTIWDGSSGNTYRTWLVQTMAALNSAGYKNIILYAPFATPGSTYASTWQQIIQYADIGDECYVNGQTVAADNYSVSAIQQIYQSSFNSWTQNAGIPASKLIEGEEFTVSLDGNGYGADGLSGADWQAAIEARDLAIHNIPFGGFIGYAWDKDAQATGVPATDLANQESYEKAYASTLVVQTEVPAWTGNDGTDSWNDYLNWTGGLPSTVSAPYPLLASYDPNLPKQTAANFETAITAPTTITLDGNQSITTLLFNSPYSYTIAPGMGGTLTLSGAGSSIAVAQGSDIISAGLILASNVTADLTGNLTLSGTLNFAGYTLIKSGAGTLSLSGSQNHAADSAISVPSGSLDLNSDAGSATAANLAVSSSGGAIIINSAQHLASFSLTGSAYAVMLTQGQYLLTHSLSVAPASTLDLTDNDLIIDYTGASPIASIQADLADGYKDGQWNGGAIMSSSVISHPGTTLGFAEASNVLGITGSQTASFDGQTVDATTVLVKYTWIGDANLDGLVNAADLALMAPADTTNATWSDGDFNYDKVVNADDYSLFMLGLTYGGRNISAITPEPALASLLLIPLLARNRRRSML